MALVPPRMCPDGLYESLPRPWAAFTKELRVLTQSVELEFQCYYISVTRRIIEDDDTKCCSMTFKVRTALEMFKNHLQHLP